MRRLPACGEHDVYVAAFLVKGEMVVPVCPFCGHRHAHSASEGWRVPHCAGRALARGSYYLVRVPPQPR